MRRVFQLGVVLLSFTIGCSSPVGGDAEPSLTDVRYSGRLLTSAEGQVQSSSVQTLQSETPDADTVMAVPLERDRRFRFRRSMIDNAVTEPIDDEGRLSLDLAVDKDWVIMLLDTDRERHEQIVAFLGLEDSDDVLLRTPTDAAEGDVDAGDAIEISGDTAYQEGTLQLNEASLGLSMSELQEIARTSNLVRAVANIYINYEKEHELHPLLVHQWCVDPDSTRNGWSRPIDYEYFGLRPYLDYSAPFPFEYESVEDGGTTVTVVPPAEAERSEEETIPEDGVSTSGSPDYIDVWGDGTEVATWDNGLSIKHGSENNIRIDIHYLKHPVAPGLWEILVDGDTVSYIDMAGSSPVLPTGEATTYVPSVRLDVNDEDYVERMHVEWKVYDPQDEQYRTVHDLDRFASTISHLGFSADSYVEQEEISDIEENEYTNSTFEFSKEWKFFDDDKSHDPQVLRGIRLTYRMYGFDFMVYIRDFD